MTADCSLAMDRRYAGGGVSAFLHIVLALVLLYRFHPIDPPTSRPETISLFDLGRTDDGRDISAQANVVLEQQPVVEPEVAKPDVELDVTKVVVPNAAWPVSEAVAVPPKQPAADAGGPSYDPYAGSAPYQRNESSYRLSVTSGSAVSGAAAASADSGLLAEPIKPSPFYLDERAFRDLQRELERILDGTRGTVFIRVRVSSDGIVTEAQVKEGSFSPADNARLTAAVMGRSLFFLREPTATAAVIDLPKLKLRP